MGLFGNSELTKKRTGAILWVVERIGRYCMLRLSAAEHRLSPDNTDRLTADLLGSAANQCVLYDCKLGTAGVGMAQWGRPESSSDEEYLTLTRHVLDNASQFKGNMSGITKDAKNLLTDHYSSLEYANQTIAKAIKELSKSAQAWTLLSSAADRVSSQHSAVVDALTQQGVEPFEPSMAINSDGEALGRSNVLYLGMVANGEVFNILTYLGDGSTGFAPLATAAPDYPIEFYSWEQAREALESVGVRDVGLVMHSDGGYYPVDDVDA